MSKCVKLCCLAILLVALTSRVTSFPSSSSGLFGHLSSGGSDNKLSETTNQVDDAGVRSTREFLAKLSPEGYFSNLSRDDVLLIKRRLAEMTAQGQMPKVAPKEDPANAECFIENRRTVVERLPGRCSRAPGASGICVSLVDDHLGITIDCERPLTSS